MKQEPEEELRLAGMLIDAADGITVLPVILRQAVQFLVEQELQITPLVSLDRFWFGHVLHLLLTSPGRFFVFRPGRSKSRAKLPTHE